LRGKSKLKSMKKIERSRKPRGKRKRSYGRRRRRHFVRNKRGSKMNLSFRNLKRSWLLLKMNTTK